MTVAAPRMAAAMGGRLDRHNSTRSTDGEMTE